MPLGIAHQSVDVDIGEGDFVHEVQPHHHHAGHPEKEDIEAGYQAGGRIECF